MEETKSFRFVYYGLIGTFIALYLAVAFVSTLHAITFFQLANTLTLAIFLGAAFEIGQASVLFSILMTKNKHRTLAWAMMFLLTSLQITANVFASFKFMDQSGSMDWQYWQRSILFWLEADSPEIYKVTIAWITGALLPIVALGLTALAADNIKLNHEDVDLDYDNYDGEWIEENPTDDDEELPYDGHLDNIEREKPIEKTSLEKSKISLDEALDEMGGKGMDFDDIDKAIEKINGKNIEKKEPVNKPRAWHLKKEFIDNDGNVFNKGKFSHKIEPPKK